MGRPRTRTPEEFAAQYANLPPVVLQDDPEPESAPEPLTPDDTVDVVAQAAREGPPPGEQTVTLTLDQISALIAQAKAEAATSAEPMTAVVSALQAIVARQDEASQELKKTRQVPLHLIKRRSPWNPTGAKLPLLRKQLLDSGFRVGDRVLRPEEIELVNQLKPGSGVIERDGYKCRWEVKETDDAIDVRTDNRTAEQRMAKQALFGGSFLGVLKAILEEQRTKGRTRASEQYVA